MSVHGILYFLFESPEQGRWIVESRGARPLPLPPLDWEYDSRGLAQVLFDLNYSPDEVETLGIAGLCILNDWSFGLTLCSLPDHSSPRKPDSPFWSDNKHCHQPGDVIRAAQNLVIALEKDHPLVSPFVEAYASERGCPPDEAKQSLLHDLIWIEQACRSGQTEGLVLVSAMAQ